MSKRDMSCIYPKSIRALTILALFLMANISSAKVLINCQPPQNEQCKAAFGVMNEMIKNLGETEAEYLLWDAKESRLLTGFWSLSFKDMIADKTFVVYTNGKYLVPNIMPILPGRDFKNSEKENTKSPLVAAAMARENKRQAGVMKNGMPFPVNQITLEQNGMWLGPMEIDKWVQQKIAFELIKGKKDHSKIVIIDDLMKDTVAIFLDEFRNSKSKWPDKEASVYFVPFFGFMGNAHSALVGKYFYSLVGANVEAVNAAFELSRLAPATKINQELLKEYCNNLVGLKNKAVFHRMSLETPTQTVPLMNKAAMTMGIMLPSYYTVNGQFKMWELDL